MFGLAMVFWMCISFNIFLLAWLVLYILINIKKIGFLKAAKSKTALSIIAWIFVCGGLPALLFAWGSIPRSGNRLFKDLILNPMPKSVEVLDSYDGDPDLAPDYCLHFKISPADFRLVLASKKWKTVSDVRSASFDCESLDFPSVSLTGKVVIYEFIPLKNDYEIMFTNAQMNEVYYFYSDGNFP